MRVRVPQGHETAILLRSGDNDGKPNRNHGGEQYAEWIKRDDNAQRLFKTYCAKWPEGDTQCVAIGDEFYVRFSNGDGMRRVVYAGDFEDEDEWCSQCGTPIDPDGGDYYCCDVFSCDAVLCDDCGGSLTCDGYYCPQQPQGRSVHRRQGTLLHRPVRVRLPQHGCRVVERGYDNRVFDGRG